MIPCNDDAMSMLSMMPSILYHQHGPICYNKQLFEGTHIFGSSSNYLLWQSNTMSGTSRFPARREWGEKNGVRKLSYWLLLIMVVPPDSCWLWTQLWWDDVVAANKFDSVRRCARLATRRSLAIFEPFCWFVEAIKARMQQQQGT